MRIINTVEINSTPEKVFYWLNNPNHAMQWMTSVTETEILKESPNMVGTTFRETIEENGRGTEMYGIVTDYIQNEVISFHLNGKFNSVDVKYNLEKYGVTTRLTQIADIHFKSILRIFSIIMWPFFKKKIIDQSQKEFMKLKKLCEQENLN